MLSTHRTWIIEMLCLLVRQSPSQTCCSCSVCWTIQHTEIWLGCLGWCMPSLTGCCWASAVQTWHDNSLVPSMQSATISCWLLYTSLQCCQSLRSTFCQSTTAASPATSTSSQHVWLSGLSCCWSSGLELFASKSLWSGMYHSFKHKLKTHLLAKYWCAQRIRDVCMRYTNLHSIALQLRRSAPTNQTSRHQGNICWARSNRTSAMRLL